jgi:hypothetical protein
MTELLKLLVFLLGYVALMRWLLPWHGVST